MMFAQLTTFYLLCGFLSWRDSHQPGKANMEEWSNEEEEEKHKLPKSPQASKSYQQQSPFIGIVNNVANHLNSTGQ